MKSLAFIILILSASPAYAGMGACHDGAGNITKLEGESQANHTFFLNTLNCEYYSLPDTQQAKYDRIKQVIKTVQKKYVKWLNEPVEMSSAEKVAVDDALAQQLDDEERTRIDALDVTVNDVIIALVKRINVRIPSNPITKAEVIQQIKDDKGL